EDLYGTLQVQPSADLEAIHAAYRRLARRYHPDLNPRPEAAERMRQINVAYRVLSDPRQRPAYDAQRYLQPTTTQVTAVRPRARPVVVYPAPAEPGPLQRRADRVVALLGILLIVLIGMYSAFIIPRAEPVARQFAPTAGVPAAGTDANVSQRLRTDVGLRS